MEFLSKIKPHFFFLIAALFFEWQYNQVTPPLQAPDEFNHFFRALQISEGQFSTVKQNNRLGGQVPESVRQFVLPYSNAATNLKYTLTKQDIYDSFHIKYNRSDTVFVDYPNTALHSPLSYLPHAAALYVFKKLDLSLGTMYYSGRIVMFLIWLIAMFFVIKMMPFAKWLITFLLLLPMNLYVVNSFSADTVTNIISFLFISYVLKLASEEKKITYLQLIYILILIVSLAQVKVVYIGLILLLLVLPRSKYNSFSHFLVSNLALFISAFAITYYWSDVIMSNYIPYASYNKEFRDGICLSNCANYFEQKAIILGDGSYFLNVIYRSIFEHPITFINGYIGILGNSDIFIDRGLMYMAYLLIGTVALTEQNKFALSIKSKLILFTAAFTAFVLLLLSQHLTWDCVGEGIVDLVQGRYLIPIFPLLFLMFAHTKSKVKLVPNVIVMIFPFILNHYAAKAVYDRFYVDSYYKRTEFYCGAEKATEKDYLTLNFKTSDTSIVLESTKCWTDSVSRTGKYAIMLSPKGNFSMIYKFKNISHGDLIEVTAWQKGKGAQLVISGNGSGCKDFYFPSSAIQYYDSSGWGKMQLVQSVQLNCDTSAVTFFIWNPDSTRTYVDDIHFSLKKFKGNYIDSIPKQLFK